MVIFLLSSIMDAIPEALVSEEACAAVLAWGCICFLPLRNWWRTLTKQTKAKIPLILSAIIGTSDTGLDWAVLIGWYEEGLWKIATAMILLIIIAGSFFAYIVASDLDINHLPIVLLLTCLGLGNIVLAFLLVRQSPIDPETYYVCLKDPFWK